MVWKQIARGAHRHASSITSLRLMPSNRIAAPVDATRYATIVWRRSASGQDFARMKASSPSLKFPLAEGYRGEQPPWVLADALPAPLLLARSWLVRFLTSPA